MVDYTGKSKSIFNELEEQYGFVGGSEQDYVKHLRRDDIPAGMWRYIPLGKGKAFAGFSWVSKKDASKQRKLLMSCATNYMVSDVRERAEHGLRGGEALAGMLAPSDEISVSSFDESNAFSFI